MHLFCMQSLNSSVCFPPICQLMPLKEFLANHIHLHLTFALVWQRIRICTHLFMLGMLKDDCAVINYLLYLTFSLGDFNAQLPKPWSTGFGGLHANGSHPWSDLQNIWHRTWTRGLQVWYFYRCDALFCLINSKLVIKVS